MKGGRFFWKGVGLGIPACCSMFFENEWQSIRKISGEYGELMHVLTGNEGIVLCPECLVKSVHHK